MVLPGGKPHSQIDVLIDKRWHSSIVQTFRGADCDTDHYQMVAEVTERLSISKREAQRFDIEKFNHKKQHDVEVKEQYRYNISSRCAALENSVDNDVEMNSAWEST